MKAIERFMSWFKSLKFWKAFLYSFLFIKIWTIPLGFIFSWCGLKFSQNVYRELPATSNSLIEACLIAPIGEEILFRWIPMLLLSFVLLWLYRTAKVDKERFFIMEKHAILTLAIVSSIVFGWVHGNFLNVFIQGVSGLVIFLLYLRIFFIRRDKGLRNRWQVVSLGAAMLLHALSNII